MPHKDPIELALHFIKHGNCINCGGTQMRLQLAQHLGRIGWRYSCATKGCKTTWFKPVKNQ